MKNRNIFLLLCGLLLISTAGMAQKHKFAGDWYVSDIKSTDPSVPQQTFKPELHTVHVTNDGHYELNNFLDIKKMAGEVVISDRVAVLSDGERGYFAVFQLLALSKDEFLLRHVPFQQVEHSMQIRFRRYEVSKEPVYDFSGSWLFQSGTVCLKIEFEQDGNRLKGYYNGGQNCSSGYKIRGVANGEHAEIEILNPLSGAVIGKAYLEHTKFGLGWKIIEQTKELKTMDNVLLSRPRK